MLALPAVDDSLGSLTPWRWVLLLCSFFASLALFALFVLLLKSGVMWVWPTLVCFLWAIAKMPMEVYAQNRKGRVVAKLYLGILVTYSLYKGWDHINSQFSKYPFILVILLAICGWVYWFTLETAKVNEQLIKRLDALQEKTRSIESNVDQIKRILL